MKFAQVIPPLLMRLQEANIDFAFIGGVAVYLSGVDRMSDDVDFLTLLSDSDKIDTVLTALGFERLFKSDNAANYWKSGPEGGRVDFLFAHRPYTQTMLKKANTTRFLGMPVKTLRPKDLIGLKVQSSSNDPDRARKDLFDIEDLMARHGKTMDWTLIGEYFDLFKRSNELEGFRKKYQCR
jgi:hypothetical protein